MPERDEIGFVPTLQRQRGSKKKQVRLPTAGKKVSGWCWYYPPGWYPVGYSYNTGTVLMQMGDPDDFLNFGEDIEADVAWFGALDGLLSSSSTTNAQSITNGINQAFAQSPYIQSNQ